MWGYSIIFPQFSQIGGIHSCNLAKIQEYIFLDEEMFWEGVEVLMKIYL